MAAPRRENDPKRTFVYPGGGNRFEREGHEQRAQEYFQAHGFNKGINKDMDTRAAMEQAYSATAPADNNSRKETVKRIRDAGNLTDNQAKQIKGK